MLVYSFFSAELAARPKKINFYFLCIQEPNKVALLYGRRPTGPSAPRSVLGSLMGTP